MALFCVKIKCSGKKYGKIQKNAYSYIWMSKFEKLYIFLQQISFKGSKHWEPRTVAIEIYLSFEHVIDE
jgi:hypothetical protein